MASIQREVVIDAAPEHVWDAMRDIGALHTRLVSGFVVDCRLDGADARVVTFANSVVAREVIVDVNDTQRRIAWSAAGGRLAHHNASAQVFTENPNRCRIVWIADLLPHAMAPAITVMIEQGLAAMKRTLERRPEAAPAP